MMHHRCWRYILLLDDPLLDSSGSLFISLLLLALGIPLSSSPASARRSILSSISDSAKAKIWKLLGSRERSKQDKGFPIALRPWLRHGLACLGLSRGAPSLPPFLLRGCHHLRPGLAARRLLVRPQVQGEKREQIILHSLGYLSKTGVKGALPLVLACPRKHGPHLNTVVDAQALQRETLLDLVGQELGVKLLCCLSPDDLGGLGGLAIGSKNSQDSCNSLRDLPRLCLLGSAPRSLVPLVVVVVDVANRFWRRLLHEFCLQRGLVKGLHDD
mmetsp:Transcript_26415/g.74334  ORF Transcript_26415/g.74334 Transcript_26415/m.74334 type:complete len:272 (+) Transcript_26415:283-1098(+)